jgi:hypothetical protein
MIKTILKRLLLRSRPNDFHAKPILFDWSILNKVIGHFEARKHTWETRGIDGSYPIGDYFEFGCYNGDTVIDFVNVVIKYYSLKSIPKYWNIHIFDSFEGLPSTAIPEDLHPYAGQGSYKSTGQDFVNNRILSAGWPSRKLEIHPGFYEKILTEELRDSLLGKGVFASFVNIDCDYYSSTMTVLNWIEPLLVDGSIIYFDDIYFYNCNPHKGELRAINDFNCTRENSGLALAPFFDMGARVYMYWKNENISPKRFEFKNYVVG